VVKHTRPEGAIRVIRGEVWLAALDPTVRSEIQKTRPCVILSPPEINERLARNHRCANDHREPTCPFPSIGVIGGGDSLSAALATLREIFAG
jgi:PemK-like, MazF-like toxin of type II toxin-antitoxin system